MALRFFLSVCKILGKSPSFPPMSLYEEVSYLVVFICACSVRFLCFNSLIICFRSKRLVQIPITPCNDCGALTPGDVRLPLQSCPRDYLWL